MKCLYFRWEDTLLLKCVVVRQFPKVLKLFCTDGENKIAVIAFGKEMEQLKALTLDNSVFSLSCIQVNAENSAYATGSFNGLEIILTSGSQIKVVEQKEITFPYEFTSVQEAKSKDDSQFIGTTFNSTKLFVIVLDRSRYLLKYVACWL